MTTELLGLIIITFFITSLLLIPFIDFLYYLRSKRIQGKNIVNKNSTTPIHDSLMKKDYNTPVGGGILVIVIVLVLTYITFKILHFHFSWSIYIIFFSMISFGLLGLFDDLRHIYTNTLGKFHGLSALTIFIFQIILSVTIAFFLYFGVGLNNIFVPIYGNIILGLWYIPLAALVITTFSNAFNISDGLDGLSTGLLIICLFAFLALVSSVFDKNLAVFTGIWIGSLIAYLYFNVFPARVYLGDAGAFSFGATLAVIGLLTGKIVGLGVIGGVFIFIISSSFLQILSKKILKRKLFPVAPLHMYFKYIGWEEPKIVQRFWLAGAILAILGLWLALMSN